jgi:hypothetical protein
MFSHNWLISEDRNQDPLDPEEPYQLESKPRIEYDNE